MRRLSPALAALTLAGVTLAAPAARAATVTVVGPAAPALVGSAASNSPGIDLAVSCFDAALTRSSSAPARSARVAVWSEWVSWSTAKPSVTSARDSRR